MDRYPVDSAEAAEFRERGQHEGLDVDGHDLGCVDGWAGEDHLGRPRPCRRCHPRLRLPRGRW